MRALEEHGHKTHRFFCLYVDLDARDVKFLKCDIISDHFTRLLLYYCLLFYLVFLRHVFTCPSNFDLILQTRFIRHGGK